MKEAVARKRAELAARDARILTLNQVCVIYTMQHFLRSAFYDKQQCLGVGSA